jgi:hypothetical protein
MIRIRSSAIVFLAFFTVCGRGFAQGKQIGPPEQTQFSAEDESVQKPVSIPDDVLAILSKDELVRDELEEEMPPEGKPPQAWFSASAVHLSGPDEIDLVVLGESLLRGANVITFWVFRSAHNAYELVLTAPAHDLIVQKTRWNGYKEIEMSAESAVTFTRVQFRWDGRKYAEFREKTENIR